MSFKKNKYLVVKNCIPRMIANYSYHYLLLKRAVFQKLPTLPHFGTFRDDQVPGTYSHYSDVLMDTLLVEVHPIMEKKTKLKLFPTYSYCRVYKKGDVLERHKDRPSCEISTTLNLGGDNWPIYLEPSGKEGLKGVKINLKQGDMLIYSGCELEHWREPFEGEECTQVFLHYSTKLENRFDKRPMLGLPK
jgi:hypothetical protein|tara:strand:- start:291 stop:860 length:570 start_codon:yes stop_codon:yes gene_type:complete